ncbi:MAG: hypothetical protein AABW51_04435 [Nanoarchaeota archaeon]
MELKEVETYLKRISQDNIEFDPHFYKKIAERPINESIVRSYLSNINKLEKIEFGKEDSNRFKLWFKMSSNYSLVVIIEILIPKGLKVISAWNTNRKWQNKLKK